MTYTIRWKDCQKSDAVASHLEEKLAKFQDFHFVLPEAKAEIVFYDKKQNYTARINIQVKEKGVIRAEATAEDVLTAINDATDKILDQLRRVKTQFKSTH